MKTESRLTIVTGAPGTGKTTTVTQFLKIRSDVIVLDIDWLAESAGKLAEKDIYSDASTWKPYGELWFEFLHSIYRNSKQAIFFTPNTPSDIESVGKPFGAIILTGYYWIVRMTFFQNVSTNELTGA